MCNIKCLKCLQKRNRYFIHQLFENINNVYYNNFGTYITYRYLLLLQSQLSPCITWYIFSSNYFHYLYAVSSYFCEQHSTNTYNVLMIEFGTPLQIIPYLMRQFCVNGWSVICLIFIFSCDPNSKLHLTNELNGCWGQINLLEINIKIMD